MTAANSTPYQLLGVLDEAKDSDTRNAYRARILELKQDRLKPTGARTITADKFRLICRAYETLSDRVKRQRYDQTKQWTSHVSLDDYTLQQLAAEPDLVSQLKHNLRNAKLEEVNVQDRDTGQTALYCAARACNVEAVLYLIDAGAEPDLKQKTGSTALHVSAFYGHPEMVRCLLESGANYSQVNSFNNLAETESWNDAVRHVFAELKQHPYVQAAADQLDWFKTNTAHLSQHIDYQYNILRQTLLQCASKKGHTALVHWLVEHRGANLDIVDVNSNSALHLAAYNGHGPIVEYLLDRGANSLLINKWGMTAEQEGFLHKEPMKQLFKSIRARDIFKMAADGVDWWFRYHFGTNSVDAINDKGASLLYIACRYGRTSVAKWLLENEANVNVQLQDNSKSTPLHGAAYNGHVPVVELLLSYGADVKIKNKFGSTVFDDAQSDEMKTFLQHYRQNLKDNKLLSVHLFADGAKSGNNPLAKLQLHCDATLKDLHQSMSADLRQKYRCFSIARRPLNFEGDHVALVSAVCRARHGTTKFVELPLCITVHESPRYTNSGHVTRPELSVPDRRNFHSQFISKCDRWPLHIHGNINEKQEFSFNNLLFTFPAECTPTNVVINVNCILKPNSQALQVPECLCMFEIECDPPDAHFRKMPIVSLTNEPDARLFWWTQTSPYWFTSNIRHARLSSMSDMHAFVRHVDIIPSQLSLPADIFIPAAVGTPLRSREKPVSCECLTIREHNKSVFPHIAYHGTTIDAIRSILMDGLVMPSTVVSSGIRVCPPSNHIARGVEAFHIPDFANAIFISPSIHYCSDPAYAVTFSRNDERMFAVLELSVKQDAYGIFPNTVPGYVPHPTDDIKAIEWRLTNPAAVELLSILFIPVMKSRIAMAKARASKLGVDPNKIT